VRQNQQFSQRRELEQGRAGSSFKARSACPKFGRRQETAAPPNPGSGVPVVKGTSGPCVKTLKKRPEKRSSRVLVGTYDESPEGSAPQHLHHHHARLPRLFPNQVSRSGLGRPSGSEGGCRACGPCLECLSALIEACKARWCNVVFELGSALCALKKVIHSLTVHTVLRAGKLGKFFCRFFPVARDIAPVFPGTRCWY
jgi:hypothetical protein